MDGWTDRRRGRKKGIVKEERKESKDRGQRNGWMEGRKKEVRKERKTLRTDRKEGVGKEGRKDG